MVVIFAVWAGVALACLLLPFFLAMRVMPSKRWFGILIDQRGRCSLTHFQLFVWSVLIVSLIAGVFVGRWVHGEPDPLAFKIPGQVLGLLGISVGSAVTATAVKAAKDVSSGSRIAASGLSDPPRLGQIFLLEEGQYADQAIDLAKFQSFLFTIVLAIAYIVLAVHAITKSGGSIAALPSFSGTFLVLVGISQGGYVANKLSSSAGDAPGLTVKNKAAGEGTASPRNAVGARLEHTATAALADEIAKRQQPGEAVANWAQAERERHY
jgi:hypothetical protein